MWHMLCFGSLTQRAFSCLSYDQWTLDFASVGWIPWNASMLSTPATRPSTSLNAPITVSRSKQLQWQHFWGLTRKRRYIKAFLFLHYNWSKTSSIVCLTQLRMLRVQLLIIMKLCVARSLVLAGDKMSEIETNTSMEEWSGKESLETKDVDSAVNIFCENLFINLCGWSNKGLGAPTFTQLAQSASEWQHMTKTPQSLIYITLMCRVLLNRVLCVARVSCLWCFCLFPQHVTSVVNDRINRKWRLLPCLNIWKCFIRCAFNIWPRMH